jgi:fatty acid desaturase
METEAAEDDASPPYGEYLVWFMRAVAVLWLAKGLMHWSLVLGLGEGEDTRFLAMPMITEAATVFFAVLDLVAAVGLWMAAAWGGVIWIIAAMSHLLLNVFMPHVFGRQLSFISVIAVLVAIYLGLTYLAARKAAMD